MNSVYYLLLAFSILCHFSAKAQPDTDLIAYQKQLIGEMSGKSPISNGQLINARNSAEEREIARMYLSNQLESLGLKPKIQSYQMPNLNPLIDLLFSPFDGGNVYATLPATVPSDEYIVLGAHFDTDRGCPGAIDNASGSALILGIARLLKSADQRSKNVIIVFFDQEEEELVGSQAFAKYLKKQKLTIHSVHTFDMIAWDEDGNKEVEIEMPTPYLEALYRKKSEEMGIPVYTANINSTDHHAFRQAGYPAVGVNEAYGKRDTSPYKDTPEDTFDTVNFDYLAGSTLFVLEVIKEILK